jgi:hypothetical protein
MDTDFRMNILEPTIKPVTRLLRRRGSPDYYNGNGWTKNANEAETFPDVLEATKTCIQQDLQDVELVLRMSTGVCDIFSTGIR